MARTFCNLVVFTIALLSIPALAQDTAAAAAGAPGCGDPDAKYQVQTAAGQPPAQAEAGKALVYFIENDSNFSSFPKPTTRIGVDGQWVGATHGNSYLYFSVDPGVHHLCTSWQMGVILGKGRQSAAAHFKAEAGGVYYFQVKNTFFNSSYSANLDVTLAPLDSDEGQLLVGKYELSTSRVKK